MDIALLIGRLLLVFLFVFSGTVKFIDLSGTAGHIAEQGLPIPAVLAAAAGTVEVVGGLLVAFGFKTRYAAIALVLFTIAATVIFHDFWTVADRAEQVDQMLHAFKNVSIVGGLICLAAFGPGGISLDARRSRRRIG